MMTSVAFLGILSVICSLLYGFWFTKQQPSVLRTILKAIPVGCLAFICVILAGPITLTLALVLGALGDIFLSREGERNFLFGLGAFLLGHIAYILLLAMIGEGASAILEQPWRLLACLVLVAVAVFVTRQLLPHLGELKNPVLVYVAVITLMGAAAFTLPITWPYILAIFGALLFITSDSILGFETFVFDPSGSEKKWSSPVLWFFYWGGQLMITAAVLMVSTGLS